MHIPAPKPKFRVHGERWTDADLDAGETDDLWTEGSTSSLREAIDWLNSYLGDLESIEASSSVIDGHSWITLCARPDYIETDAHYTMYLHFGPQVTAASRGRILKLLKG